MKRLLAAIVFIVCLCAFASVSLAYSTHYGYFGPPIGDCGTWVCSSGFGPRDAGIGSRWHKGVDIAAAAYDAPDGFAIAAADGVVVAAEEGGGYINYVIIKHSVPDPDFPNGLYTLYGDIVAINSGITEGVSVRKGQILGFCGPYEAWHYEYSSAPHVHWEVRPDTGAGYFNEEAFDPALFLADLEESGYGSSGSGIGDPHRAPANGPYGEFQKVIIEFKYEMVKGFREIFEGFAKAIIEAFRHIHSIIRSIFIILIMIDLALAMMFKMFDEQLGGEELLRIIVARFLFYGILLMMIEKFPDLSNHLVRDFFIAATGKAMSLEEAEVANIISDPMMIIEKGLYVIQPMINNTISFSFPQSVTDWAFFLMPGSTIIQFVFLIIGVLLFFLLLLFIAIMIAMAYLEFYISFLFAFTTLIFAGTAHTRKTRLANRGLTAVFACSLNLMFHAMLAVLLTQSMVAIQSQAGYAGVTQTVQAEGSPIKDAADLRNRIRNAETGGRSDPYHDNVMAGATDGRTIEGYGAFHIRPSDWDAWTEEAWLDGAPLIRSEFPSNEPPTPGSHFSWSPQNQETLALWKMEKDYKSSGSWENVAHAWYNLNPHAQPFNEYWSAVARKPLNETQQTKVPTGAQNLLILIQLNLCMLVFVVMAYRMSNSIKALFKGNGFELLNSQSE